MPQLGALAATLLTLLALTALGSLVGGVQRRVAGADTLVGMGLGGGALAILAASTRVALSIWAIILGLVALVALAAAMWRRTLPGGWHFAVALLLLGPLLLVAAAGPATMWDDFGQWLPCSAYLYQYNSLLRPDLPSSFCRYPAYPQTMPLLIAISSWLAGRFLESSGPIANSILLASFSAVLADVAINIRPSLNTRSLAGKLGVAGAATAASSILYPGLDYNVLFSSYADVATMVAVGVLGLVGILMIEHLGRGRNSEARMLAWRFGFVAAALVNLKPANPVLLALLLTGLALVAWRDPRLPRLTALRLLPTILGPSLILLLIWRAYVANNLVSAEMSFRSVAEWNFDQWHDMIGSIIGWLFMDNPLFYSLMWLVAIGGFFLSWRQRNAGERLFVITAVVWFGYNFFIVFVYLGVMTPEEAAWAADYWRYMPHVGLLAISAIAVWLLVVSWPSWVGIMSRVSALACIVAVPAVSLVRADELSPEAKSWPMHYRKVGLDMADMLPSGARPAVVGCYVDPMPVALRYDLWRLGREDRGLRAITIWGPPEPDTLIPMFREGTLTHLVLTADCDFIDQVTESLGIPPLRGETALYEWTGPGWLKLRSWPLPCRFN
jgi:hypothetical protein